MWLWVGDGSLCGCELVKRGVAVGGWWVMVWQMMHGTVCALLCVSEPVLHRCCCCFYFAITSEPGN